MALIRTNTTWFGSAGAPFYTQNYWLGAGDVTHANDAIDAINLFLNTIQPHLDNALTWVVSGEVEVIDVSTGQIQSVVAATEETNSGFSSAEALPTFTQALLRLNTGTFLNGRALRGRMFIPGMVESNNTVDGRPAAGMRGDILNAANTLAGDSADLAVYSRTHHAASSVQSVSVWDQWAVLRSRRD